MKPLRIVVVGVGHMGRHHARKVAELARERGSALLVGVVDVDGARARQVADELGTRAEVDPKAFYEEADAAVVAVPTLEHCAVANAALEAGLDVLVEKPIAASPQQAERLLEHARRRGAVLRVGHQEWFNGALRVIREHVRAPRFVEAHRIGPFSERSTDVDVVRDLMIHDIDILQRLLGEQPERIEAIGVPVITDQVDTANARIAFAGGCIADLTASRVSMTPMRKLRFFQRDACFSIDFLNSSAVLFRRMEGDREPRVEMEELEIHREDALLNQLAAFVEACRVRDCDTTSAAEALRALRTALDVVEAMPSTDPRP